MSSCMKQRKQSNMDQWSSPICTYQQIAHDWQGFENLSSHQEDQSMNDIEDILDYISASPEMETSSDSDSDPAIPTTVHDIYDIKTQEPDNHRNSSNSRNISRHCRQNGSIRLWQFLRGLLLNPAFNPSHIMWINRSRGEFKIVKNKEIAQMWGDEKNNSGMTYEKMSRAMRYYYKHDILEPVLNRRLVYKFGPMSHGW
ncbi:uncharacterized protein LOC143083140 isoform X2 [Mytilus galloprovincialis]|uniref:uncharacterized protein LOC143083140 isoform X2 n=1 Tax=Mytilus galloprovincialis TaxID=29158 RepID=UPI003F7C3CE8